MSSISLAKKIRISCLKMLSTNSASHIGPIFSVVDILVVLFGKIMNYDVSDSNLDTRDRFILSKGHAGAALYAILAEIGFYNKLELNNYLKNGSKFSGHVSHLDIPGVEFTTGSLGHGLPVACGIALRAKLDVIDYKVYCILGDGELNEGSNWEAFLFAAHQKLNNLCVIIDRNNLQSIKTTEETLALEPLAEKIKSFGWEVEEVDGHNHEALEKALIKNLSKPLCVIAKTIKGKGVSFMENNIDWHYKSPTGEKYEQALSELKG
jgi:transketolase